MKLLTIKVQFNLIAPKGFSPRPLFHLSSEPNIFQL